MLESLVFESRHHNDWARVDLTGQLRMRAFPALCIAPVIAHLEASGIISAMREDGIARVLHAADFEQHGQSLAIGAELVVRHRLSLHISRSDPQGYPDARGQTRILWHTRYRIDTVPPGTPGTRKPVASATTLHVLTRPHAERTARAVTTVPPALAHLRLSPWTGRLPKPDMLGLPVEADRAFDDVWGVANTDIKGHVNGTDYLIALENQAARQLHDSGLDPAGYNIRRLRVQFRRPFFAGEPYRIRSRLETETGQRSLLAGLYLRSDNPLDRPGVLARLDLAALPSTGWQDAP